MMFSRFKKSRDDRESQKEHQLEARRQIDAATKELQVALARAKARMADRMEASHRSFEKDLKATRGYEND